MRTIYLGHNPIYAAVCHEETDLAAVFWHDCSGNMAKRSEEMVEYCRQKGVNTIYHSKIDRLTKKLMTACEPDLIVVGEYHFLLKQDTINIARVAAINMHGAPLPLYRGAHPINWMIINGEEEGAVTCHYITEGLDSGDIIAQYTFPILLSESAFDVRPKIEETGMRLLRDVLQRFNNEGKLKGIPQDAEKASYFPPRRPEDGGINWDTPALSTYNFIRALSKPYPGAFSYINNIKVSIFRAEIPLSDDIAPSNLSPGTIVRMDKKSFRVTSGDGRFVTITEWESCGAVISEGKHFEDN